MLDACQDSGEPRSELADVVTVVRQVDRQIVSPLENAPVTSAMAGEVCKMEQNVCRCCL